MKALALKDGFGLDKLRLEERDTPKPASDQVLVRIHAVSLNYRDLLMVEGKYLPRLKFPLIPISDGAGEIVEVGALAAQKGWKVGERVASTMVQGWHGGDPAADATLRTLGGPLDGVCAEYVCLSNEGLVRLPEGLTWEEGATLPIAALTAWNAVVTLGKVKPGDVVLTLGTGGVSLFALQFALLAGAKVILTSRSEEKLKRGLKMGAHHGIWTTQSPEWDREVRRLCPDGVDLVVEVGGAGTLERSMKATRSGGTIALIGVLDGGQKDLSLFPILMRQLRVQGVFVGHTEDFRQMCRAIAASGLRPVIDATYPLEQFAAAFEQLKSGQQFGKIVVRLG